MAINRISGNILQDNLLRGANLAIQTDLIFFDIISSRVGIKTSSPQYDLDVNGNARADNYIGNTVSVAGNVTGGNINSAGVVTASGNVTGGNIITVGLATVTGNVIAGNLTSLGTISSPEILISGNANVGNLGTTGLITATGNVIGGNVTTIGEISAGGNATVGNLETAGLITATGNITGGNLISNGVVTATGNIDTSSGILATGNVTAGNVNSSDSVTALGNINGANLNSSGTVFAVGNVNGGNVITTGLVTAAGNIDGGNLNTAGVVTATGNVTGGNLLTVGLASVGGSITVSGNANVGNLGTLGEITATGNITGGNVLGSTAISTPGNVVAGNLVVGDKLIPTSGNIDAGNVNIANLAVPVLFNDAATKGYVDGLVSNVDITITDGANTQTIGDNSTLTFSSTANQTTVVVSAVDTVTFGIAANISVDSILPRSTGNISLTTGPSNFVTVNSTSGFSLPVGNTSQRPASPPTGTLRFNTNSTEVEVWDGNQWTSVGSPSAQITNQYITGDGSTVVFTLNQTTTSAGIIVSTNGVIQFPDVAYTVSGNQITFAEAPASSDVIDVRFTTLLDTINGVSNASGQELTITVPGVVDITNTHSLKLPSYSVAQATALGNVSDGQMIYVTNGDSGNPCLAVYSGSAWKRVSLGANIST